MSDPAANVPEITPLELARALEAGEALQVVDVRSPTRVASGRIDLVPAERFHNIVGSQLQQKTSLDGTGIALGMRTVVVCGKGNDSKILATHLGHLGLDASSLHGGMAAWMKLQIARAIEPPTGVDRLLQFDRIGKGSLAYLVVSGGEALVVDPPRDVEPLLAAARAAGARVIGVADTHAHADYISGASALSRALGVPYHLHPADNVYPFDDTPGTLAITPLADGTPLRVGRTVVTARHTPGHTMGMTSYAIGDEAVLSGDFVFVESLGRPDLAGRADAWAPVLWDTLERAKREWPAGALVLPGHYSSDGERRADRAIAARFGDLLRTNPALGITDRAAFLRWATAPAPVPASYPMIKAINAGLEKVEGPEADELELGRNECALSRPA